MEVKVENPFVGRRNKFKSNDPLVWVIDNDLEVSAHGLTNEYLNKTIVNLIQILVDVKFYFAGIRNKRYYQYYFNKERKEETMSQLFPGIDGYTPKMKFQTHRTTKWARRCLEHYEYFRKYLNICFLEYNARRRRFHKMSDIILFLLEDSSVAEHLPKANIEKVTLDWKNIPKRIRCRDVLEMYRRYYVSLIGDPFIAYKDSNVDIPDFVIKANTRIV